MTYFAVPARHLEHAKGQLETIVPNAGDRVIPIESFDALAEGRKDIARAKTSVKRILQSNEAIDWIRVNARVPGSWTSAFVGPARKPA